MNAKIKKIFIIIGVLIAGVIFFAVFIRSVAYSPASELTVPEFTEDSSSINIVQSFLPTQELSILKTIKPKIVIVPDMPARLIIPSLDIDTDIQHVGITKQGRMAVPTNYTDVGWYKYGVVPGKMGSAVIAGHVDNGLSLPGVFKNLEDLKPGDEIFIVFGDGTRKRFVMTGHVILDRNDSAETVFNQNDGVYIKLITCTGDWVSDARTHSDRLVVTAVLQES